MHISLFSYGRPVVVRCMGVGLGMGWVGSVISWVGLGWVDENRPKDNYGVAGFDGRWPSGNLSLNVRVLSIYTKRTFAFGRILLLLLLLLLL